MRRSPAFAAAVILAFAGLDIALITASWLGWDALDLTPFDYVTSALSIPLSLAAGVGLLCRRLWGWTAAVAGVALGVLIQVAWLPFDDGSWSVNIAAFGVVLLIDGAILALLNGGGVRAALSPRPPETGLLGDLPVEPCFSAGFASIIGGLALEVGWGWMILVLWIAIVLARRLRRRAESPIVP